jgi:hypothetical protein
MSGLLGCLLYRTDGYDTLPESRMSDSTRLELEVKNKRRSTSGFCTAEKNEKRRVVSALQTRDAENLKLRTICMKYVCGGRCRFQPDKLMIKEWRCK